MFDTHCHIDLPHYAEDRAEVIQRAWDAGFTHLMIPGIELSTAAAGIMEIVEAFSTIFFASGIHPNNAKDLPADWLEQVETIAKHPKCRAIGEIGLDYYWEYCPHDIQRRVFSAQLTLAGQMDFPVIVHCREAYDDLWPLLSQWLSLSDRHRAVLHAYNEDVEKAMEAVRLGCMFGIGGTYTYTKNNERRLAILEAIPMENILLETDCPYLTPHPHRGERNEPALARFTAEKIATVKNISFEEVDAITTQNALTFFGIDPA